MAMPVPIGLVLLLVIGVLAAWQAGPNIRAGRAPGPYGTLGKLLIWLRARMRRLALPPRLRFG